MHPLYALRKKKKKKGDTGHMRHDDRYLRKSVITSELECPAPKPSSSPPL